MADRADIAVFAHALSVAGAANYHRESAAQLRARAVRVRDPDIAAQLLRIAQGHERLAAIGEGGGIPEEPIAPPLEGPIHRARRHVIRSEARVAQQQALVRRLQSDPRHAALAAQADTILATLTHSLKLAREHLALELAAKSGARAEAPAEEMRRLLESLPAPEFVPETDAG